MPTPVIAELYRGKAKTLAQAAALVAARRQASQPEKPPGAEGPPEDDLQMKVCDDWLNSFPGVPRAAQAEVLHSRTKEGI
jgi:hypothetical protein